ncbi:hypothetical protein BD410DRAFT_788348 [Rickenella mellea]|uniref:Endopeptidase S2P n=1 Tax=Rickenella mellea TaxID=50990 RepID=A0A4Y7Q4M8_9AGAM|nr:hypothetical protein BD410DRAFT_788348 [Rickenella mellea]
MPHFSRRRLDQPNTPSPSSPARSSGFGLNPIIPGVTVPLWHLPIVIITLFVTQIVHEAGHAISAASDALPLHSLGFSLTIILPSAFTSLSPSISLLPVVARLRIISAGAWHNLIFWSIIYIASLAGVSHVWEFIGWIDVSDRGIVVLSVDQDSPLFYHLNAGTVITHLDDNAMRTGNEFDTWFSYLSESSIPLASSEGWCVDATWFEEQSSSCCTEASGLSHPPATQVSCFMPFQNNDAVSLNSAQRRHCIDPIPVLTPNHPNTPVLRCTATTDCVGVESAGLDRKSWECVRPDDMAQLLRISVEPPHWDSRRTNSSLRKTIIWSGPKWEVLAQVEVGKYQPRSPYLPLWLPDLVSLFCQYLGTISLSLYFFNLFCLPFLDGSQLLSCLLDASATEPPPENIDLESAQTPGRNRSNGIHRHGTAESYRLVRLPGTQRGFTIATAFLLCTALIGAVY